MVTTATYAIASGTTFDSYGQVNKDFMALSLDGNQCLTGWSCTSFKLVQKKNSEGYFKINLQKGIHSIGVWQYLDLVSTQQTVTIPSAQQTNINHTFKYSATGTNPFSIQLDASQIDPIPSKTASKVTFTFTFNSLFNCTMFNTPNGEATIIRPDDASISGNSTGNTIKICEGDTVQLISVPNARYRFVEWQTTPSVVVTNNTFLMPSTNITVKPIFERYIFDISIGQTQLGAASANTYSSIEGNTIILTAYPDTGYQLLRWNSSPYVEITNNSFSMPNKDVIITPVFKKIPSNVNAGYYNGSTYLSSIPLYYDGTNWIECTWQYYDNNSWLNADAT